MNKFLKFGAVLSSVVASALFADALDVNQDAKIAKQDAKIKM